MKLWITARALGQRVTAPVTQGHHPPVTESHGGGVRESHHKRTLSDLLLRTVNDPIAVSATQEGFE